MEAQDPAAVSHQTHFDLVVIGGGPGGCSAAISAARKGASVLLLERSAYPRHKVCGEFVSPESLPLLLDLLGKEEFENLQSLPIDQVEISTDGGNINILVAPPASSITRFKLDNALWDAAVAAGVACKQKVAANQISGAGPFKVRTSEGEFSAPAVIDATGRWSNLNATVELKATKLLGIKGHFDGTTTNNCVHLYFFPAGYCAWRSGIATR